MWDIYTIEAYHGLLLNHEKEGNNAICSNMDATRDSHTSEVRERQISYDITSMQNLKKTTQMNASMHQEQTHRQREQTGGCQGGDGGGMDGESETSRCKLIDTGWIENTFLL